MASVADLEARRDEVRAEITEINNEYAGARLPEDITARWNDLNGELDELTATLDELSTRRARIEELSKDENHREVTIDLTSRGGSRKVASKVPDNVFAVEEYRSMSSTHDEYTQALRDGAMRAVESATMGETEQGNVARLLDTIDGDDKALALRVLQTGSPAYTRAFAKHLGGKNMSQEEQRALGIGAQGGTYPVPYVIDPTVILTSNGVLNPIRQIARVVNITGNHWTGVASTGITAAYSAEAVEATDNSPTLTQPTADVEKAKAFVPYSIEAGEDWGALQSEMARLLQDAKDVLEATKFLSGVGHAQQEPQGLHTGATTVVTTASTATFVVADLYSLEQALPPRWVPGASIVANKATLNKIRQFDTAGGASLWVQLGNGLPSRLLDYPTYQYSSMSSTPTTTGATTITIGDFSQYLILERVGMSVEVIQHLFGTTSNYPTGQRGIFAYWRNTSGVLTIPAFRSLKVL